MCFKKSYTLNRYSKKLKSSKNNSGLTTPDPSKGGEPVGVEADGKSKKLFADNFERPRFKTANPASYGVIKKFRVELKKNPTKAEEILWYFLKSKKIGHQLRRQHVVANFIVDFICIRKKLVIEVDGKIHDNQKEQDEIRTIKLNVKGFKVIRFTNEEVIKNPQEVATKIKTILDNISD